MNNDTLENARMKLGQLNIDFTINSFINHASRGDIFAIKLFLDAGMNVNAKGDYNNTALIATSSGGHTELLKLLINNGAKIDKNDKNKDGNYILRSTVIYGHLDTLKYLINDVDHGADINNHQGRNLLMIAIGNDNIEITKCLI